MRHFHGAQSRPIACPSGSAQEQFRFLSVYQADAGLLLSNTQPFPKRVNQELERLGQGHSK